MPSNPKLKVQGDSDEEEMPRVAKGKRSRQVDSDTDREPPPKRASQRKQTGDSGSEQDVDVEGSDSEGHTKAQDDGDDDVADTESSLSASPAPGPPRKHTTHSAYRPERKGKANRVESDEDGEYNEQSEPEPEAEPEPLPEPTRSTIKIPRRPTGSSSSSTPTATKPIRKPVTSKSQDAEKSSSGLGNIPAIPRRPKDVSAVVKDTQDMDLMNKDVYNQLFNSAVKPAKPQNDAKQKEINAKRAAAKEALLQARRNSFDLQLPTDKVLAFENRLRKLHRWYAPSALGFTYHEELRLQRQKDQPGLTK